MTVRPRGHWLRYSLAIVLAISCLAGLAAWRYWPWKEKHPVALPPPAAAPGKVVVTYLHALNSDDKATAEALSAPDERTTTARWLHSTAGITDIKVDSVRHYANRGEPYMVCLDYRYSATGGCKTRHFPTEKSTGATTSSTETIDG